MAIKFTVLVPVYNEAANITNLLTSLVKQKLLKGKLERIVVVASGCTDQTQDLVKAWGKKDKKIKLLTQKKREGKASAINYFLKKDQSQVVVMVGGDLLLKDKALENLVRHFADKRVCMVGAKIVSTNKADTFLGFANNVIWQLHDRMAQDHPRLGEVTAWRRVFERLPKETICDEAEIEMMVKKAGLKLVFEPQAIAYNRGPTNLKEYLARRRNNHLGHLLIQKRWGKKVESEKVGLVAGYWWRQLLKDKKRWWWYLGLAFLEMVIKFLALVDYYSGKKDQRQIVWPMAKSAKKPIKIKI
ncbi:MAG TPA: glycosyltransferase [Candidatus Bathyarchaeia archaeon]|nr:glycosyltransferase [Candidatus Bathyarchaeia archaeon]